MVSKKFSTKPDKSAQKYFWIGLLVALFPSGLSLIGITVNLWLGGIVLAGAFASLVRAFWLWERASRFKVQFRVATIVLMGLLYFGVIGRKMTAEYRIEHTPQQTQVVPPKQDIQTVLVRYTPAINLPLSVPPETTYYILQLNPKINEGMFEVSNNGSSPMWWPGKPPGKKEHPLDQIYACQLTNYGSKAILNVSVIFHLTFYSIKEAEGKYSKKGKSGSLSATLPKDEIQNSDKGRHIIRMVSVQYWHGKVTAISPDQVVSHHNHQVVVPAIPSGNSITVYLVNQSRLFADFDLPTQGNSIVVGDPRQQPMVLIRPEISPIDTTSDWMLPPSTYEWSGIPAT